MTLVSALSDSPGFLTSLLVAISCAWVAGLVLARHYRSLRANRRISSLSTMMQVIVLLAVLFALPRIEPAALGVFLVLLLPSTIISLALDRG